jgi:dihydroorotate dehydrogenase
MGLDGVIATNTTISREGLATPAEVVEAAGAGGLSGAPLHDRSLEVLHLLRPVLQGKATIISVGGIETAEQAQARLDAGATLVQGYSGFVYHGPLWARRINRALK